MKSIHIRDVPEDTLERLKRLAKMHHRSLQGELQHVLEQAAAIAKDLPTRRLKLHKVNLGGESTWSREEMYADEGR